MKKIISVLGLSALFVSAICVTNVGQNSLQADNSNNPSDLFELSNADYEGIKDYQSCVDSNYSDSGVGFNFTTLPGVIKYRNVVDLNEVNDTLIEFSANMDCEYEAKLTNIKIIVTDAYDPSLHITMNRRINPDYGTNLDDKGIRNDFVTVEYNNVDMAYPNTSYTSLQSTVVNWKSCLFPHKDSKYYPVNMIFDVATNEVKVYGYGQYDYKEKGTIYDLDDPTDTYEDFPGWTTGEVYVSIETNSTTGSLIIGKIGNDTFDEVSEDFYKRDTGSLLLGNYSTKTSLFSGVVNYKYPLPTFPTGYSGNISIKLGGVEVDFDDITNFIPTSSGRYTVTYEAQNFFKETVSKTLTFNVVNAISPVVDKTETVANFKIFEIVKVPNFKYQGGHGNLNVTINFITDDISKEVKPGDNISINAKYNNVAYRVQVIDQLNFRYTFDYVIKVNYNVVYFSLIDSFDTVTVNQGNKFVIPDFIAIDYSKFSVTKNNIDVTITSGITKAFAPLEEITVNADMNINYSYNGKILKTLVVKCAPANVKPYDDNYYFDKHMNSLEGINSVAIRDIGTVFSLKTGDVSITMPYTLSATNLGLSFNIVKNKNNFSSIDIKYESVSGEYVLVNLTNQLDKSVLSVNDEPTPYSVCSGSSLYDISDDLKLKGSTYYSFGLSLDSPSASILNDNSAKIISLDKWASGFDFTGFQNGGARVTFTIHDAKDGDLFILSSISNQILTSNALTFGDVTAPCLTFDKTMLTSSLVNLNSTFVVPKCNAYDVLDNNIAITMSIQDPDGNYILRDASSQSYLLSFEKYGTYVVSYTAMDSKGNRKSYRYNFYVYDDVAPTLSLKGSYYENYYEEITVLDYSVSDNLNPELIEVSIFLVDRDLNRKLVKPGDVLKLNPGTYTLVYYVIDGNGNTSSMYYSFNMKGGK